MFFTFFTSERTKSGRQCKKVRQYNTKLVHRADVRLRFLFSAFKCFFWHTQIRNRELLNAFERIDTGYSKNCRVT